LAKGYEVRDCAACYTSHAYRRQMFATASPCFPIELPPPLAGDLPPLAGAIRVDPLLTCARSICLVRQADVTREKAAFDVSVKIITTQGPNIESKTWWLVRDNLRGQAYNMKANMLAINKALGDKGKKDADAAYKKFWSEIDQLDLACKKKELALAQKEYGDVLDALKAYQALVA
jgi:hypothetical protein